MRRRGDKRSLDQIKADIYVDLLKRRHLEPAGNDAGGGVYIDSTLDNLAGLTNSTGDLKGFGPVIADIAQQTVEQLHDSTWNWTVRDPETGLPIAAGTTRRRPTTNQKRQVLGRNRTCVHPGCRMPAVDCDIDHTINYAHCKRTCTGNLAPLCRHHHTIKHRWHWTYQRIPNGDFKFTSPLRHTHTTSGKPP